MAMESRPQTQTNPSADRFQYHARDTGSDPRGGGLGLGLAETMVNVLSLGWVTIFCELHTNNPLLDLVLYACCNIILCTINM